MKRKPPLSSLSDQPYLIEREEWVIKVLFTHTQAHATCQASVRPLITIMLLINRVLLN